MLFLSLLLHTIISINSPLLTTSDVGFTYLHLSPKKNITISLKDRMAVLLDVQSGSYGFSIKFDENSDWEVYESFPFDSVTLTGNEIKLFPNKHFSNNPKELIKIPLWILPKSLCNGTNAAISAEHHLSLNSTIKQNKSGPICLFSQIYFHAANVDIIYQTKDEHASVQIFENTEYSDSNDEVQLDTPSKICKNQEKCSAHYHQPFFIVIQSDFQKSMQFDLHYEVAQTKPNIYYCEINPIPKAISQFHVKKSPSVFTESKIKCESQANDILHIYKKIGIVLSILLVFVICLQCFNIVDFGELLCPDQETKIFDNLKTNPYAAELEEPKNGLIATEQTNI